VLALRHAGQRSKGATAYLTLEPCNHWGKTPPCAPLLIKSGVKKVFIAMEDPNPIVSGRGIKELRKEGVQVHVGLENNGARSLNRSYMTWMVKKRPYIILKMAMSLDGKTALPSGHSHWISNKTSRKLVHHLRTESDAVLIGAETALMDNPHLTSHGVGRDPLRVVIDPRLRTNTSLRLYTDKGRTLVVTSPQASIKKMNLLRKKGVQILIESLKKSTFDLTSILRYLTKINVSQLLIEGGSRTAWHFIKNGLVDEIMFFVAPVILGGVGSKSAVGGVGFGSIGEALKLKHLSVSKVDGDLLIQGRI
jgi:diaminohydroxyphosphoribosylaminopyrimidine deaminase/5-amino-6-(5-phosphoribosylamino)uracil reductase